MAVPTTVLASTLLILLLPLLLEAGRPDLHADQGYGFPPGFFPPGFGGPGWSGGYGGGSSGGRSWSGVTRPSTLCTEKGRCYKKKLTCPAKCFRQWSSTGRNYGGGGGGGGCTIDCKRCTAYC